ncbi:MAG: hypothetical protein J7494_02975 [Sphingobium sp.]|nr:hypothetical protein [Sphingobium sp.]
MQSWLLRLLPQIGLALAVIGAVWWIDQKGYRRAMTDRDARDARMLDEMRSALRQSEQRLSGSIAEIASTYERQRDVIVRAGAALQPIIMKESTDAPHLSDPAAGLTPGLLDTLNRARRAGACAAASSGGVECALPAAAAGARTSNR